MPGLMGEEVSPPVRPGHHPQGIRSMSGRYASYWNAFFFYRTTTITSAALPSTVLKSVQTSATMATGLLAPNFISSLY